MGNKGSNTTTQTSSNTSAPDPNAYQAYLNILNRANSAGSLPYTPYTGETVAPVNAQQSAGIAGINSSANSAAPYIQEAGSLASSSAQPLTAAQIQQYQNPYTQQVVNATQAQFADQNAQQLQQVRGNAAVQGALGGDREAVAEAETARQQNLAQNPVIAGLYNQSYNTALQTAQGQQGIGLQGAGTLANIGISGQNAALAGANAQLGAGGLQQQTQQQQDQSAYNQFLAAQGFPYQQLGWLAGIDTGVGSQMGGTSMGSGTTTAPAPNQTAQYAGLGLAAAGMFLNRGGRVKGYAAGGSPIAGGGLYGGVTSYVPVIGITAGHGAPSSPGTAPNVPNQQDNGANKMVDNALALAGKMRSGIGGASAWPSSSQGGTEGGVLAENLNYDVPGGIGIGSAARGGAIRGYADGGVPDISDPSSANYAVTRGFEDLTQSPITTSDPVLAQAADAYVSRHGIGGPQVIDPNEFNAIDAQADDSYTPLPRVRPAGIGVAPAAAQTDDDDDDEAVSSYAPPNPGTRTSGIMAPHGDVTDMSAQSQRKGGILGLGLVPDQYRAPLIAAGLGMLASRSPFLGTAVGEGGLSGLNAYSAQRKAEMDQQKADQEAKRLEQAADRASAQIEETKRHNLVTEKASADKAPAGMQYDKNGNLVNIPGYVDALKGQTEAKRTAAGSLDDDTIDFMADQAVAGDRTIYQNLGRGAQGAENIVKLRAAVARKVRENGGTGADQAAAVANFNAQVAAAKSAAVREATVSASVEEAKNTFPLALEASKSVPRSDFVPWNRVVQKVQAGTSSPALAKFFTATQGVITAYSQAMARTGVSTVDGRHAAEELLNTAQSPEAYASVIDQMTREMKAAQEAPETVQKAILARISGHPAPVPSAPSPAAAAAGATGVTPTTVRQNGHTYQRQPDGSYKAID